MTHRIDHSGHAHDATPAARKACRMTGGHGHSDRCVENSRWAIAENNGATEVLEPGRELTPETTEMAIEWLGNGNSICTCN